MLTLLEAIQDAFNANANLTGAFANGLELSVPADAEALPLCVLSLLPIASPMFQTGSVGNPTPWVENVTGQFSAYSQDPIFILEVEGWLDATFNFQKLTMTNDLNLITLRSGGSTVYRDSDDARVWRMDLFYLFQVQRNVG